MHPDMHGYMHMEDGMLTSCTSIQICIQSHLLIAKINMKYIHIFHFYVFLLIEILENIFETLSIIFSYFSSWGCPHPSFYHV